MDWSRLGGAVPDALVISFVLGAILSPPDPFTQLLYVGPTFVVALLALSRYGQRSVGPWWRRYLVFVGGTVVVAIAGGALALAVGRADASGVRAAFTLAGVGFGAWLAYFGGWAALTSRDP
ncbi:DUF7534 family protein [Halorussus caseinilyticus]|uniref:DUF7534 family protein n=1 Tax=Halorussus caseinilyticus TaxID=3034025 RepID=UPI0023E8A922|nr:hypothetical protein [Halorussus sp. DT72]